jgi:hypothetical protein
MRNSSRTPKRVRAGREMAQWERVWRVCHNEPLEEPEKSKSRSKQQKGSTRGEKIIVRIISGFILAIVRGLSKAMKT